MEDFNHFLIRNLSKIAIIETNRSEHRVFLKTHYFVGLPQFGKAVARRRTASTSRFGLRMRATERFDRGLTDLLNVIDAQRQQYLIEQEYVLAQQGAADQFVTLHKSLGAGWEDYSNWVPSTQSLSNRPIRGYSPRTGKSPLERECVVGLRGLELRAKHAVAIEPVSRE